MFILRYLLGHSKSSVVRTIGFLSVGGIGLGVLAMIVVLSVMNGFDDGIKGRLLGVEPHVIVQESSPLLKKKLEVLVGSSGIVESYAHQDVVIRTIDGIFSGALAEGFETGSLRHLAKRVKHSIEIFDTTHAISSPKANELTEMGFALGPQEVALGVDLARSLGILEGDEVNILAPESLLYPAGELPLYQKVHVRALLRTDVSEIDSRVVFYDINLGLRKLADSASLEKGFEIRLKNPDDAENLAAKIQTLGKFKVQTWRNLNSALFYSLKMEKSLMGLFLALTVLVSSFSVVCVLVLLVTEKRRDVGILRGMGATKRQVRKIFLSIGLTLGLLGIGGGTVMGLIVCWLVKKYPIIKLPDIYYDTSIPVRVDLWIVLGIVLLGALLTLAGTVVPAWRISEYEPIQAIRHDDA